MTNIVDSFPAYHIGCSWSYYQSLILQNAWHLGGFLWIDWLVREGSLGREGMQKKVLPGSWACHPSFLGWPNSLFSLIPNIFLEYFQLAFIYLGFLRLLVVEIWGEKCLLALGPLLSFYALLCFPGEKAKTNYISKILLPEGFWLCSANGGHWQKIKRQRQERIIYFLYFWNIAELVVGKSRPLASCPGILALAASPTKLPWTSALVTTMIILDISFLGNHVCDSNSTSQ